MPNTVTLNVVGNNNTTSTFTIMTQDKKFINSVITVGENNSITEAQMKKLQEVAARGGDKGVLEDCDLSPQEVVNLANLNGYNEYYDIKISSDGKYLQVTIKETGTFTKDPTVGTIKSDFGVRDNVFVQKDNIPYGNDQLLRNAKKSYGEKNLDWDTAKLRPGNTINIPIEEVHIQDSPRGFWGRLLCQ